MNLALAPLAAALAAGNRVMIKTCEFTPATVALLSELLEEAFPVEQVVVVGGEPEVRRSSPRCRSTTCSSPARPQYGRHVMRAAAENLTPVTLELGGKSPVIVGDDYRSKRAAERIVWGKLFNAGQTCIAPDYVLVPEGKERFAPARDAARKLYPEHGRERDYTAVINAGHYARLVPRRGRPRQGRRGNRRRSGVAGTRAPASCRSPGARPTDRHAVLQQEIFGPVLPVVGYRSLDDAIGYINENPRPLALYVFSNETATQEQVVNQTTVRRRDHQRHADALPAGRHALRR